MHNKLNTIERRGPEESSNYPSQSGVWSLSTVWEAVLRAQVWRQGNSVSLSIQVAPGPGGHRGDVHDKHHTPPDPLEADRVCAPPRGEVHGLLPQNRRGRGPHSLRRPTTHEEESQGNRADTKRCTATNIGPNHEHGTFTDDMKVPSKWREVIECRTCKRQLVVYMGDAILATGQYLLREGQKLVVAGAGEELDQDSAWYTTNLGIEQLAPAYKCTAGEGDTRVWLHVDRAPGKRKLVYSPDSDVPHIGLTSADLSSDDIIVQLSSMGTPLKLFNMNDFVECLKTDPDLHSIPPTHRGKILQVLYIATGCDFTSFFVGIGKATFLKAFFQYAQFITGL